MRALAILAALIAVPGCNLAIGLGDYTYRDAAPPDVAGQTIWSHAYGDPAHYTTPYAISVGPEGVVFVAGCSGTGDRSVDAYCTSVSNVAVDALEPSGSAKWKQRFDTGGNKGVGTGVVATATGPFVTGYFAGKLAIGATTLADPASNEVFLAHLAAGNGASQLANAYGDKVDTQTAGRIRQLPTGDLVIGGSYKGSLNFGSGTPMVTAAPSAAFVTRMSAAGVATWQRSSKAGMEQAVVTALGVGPSSEIYIGGAFTGQMDIGTGTPLTTAPGDFDAYLAKFDASGKALWSLRFGSDKGTEVIRGVAVDAAGAVVIAGELGSGIDFGGATKPLVTKGKQDAFVAKLDATGAGLWSMSFGDLDDDVANDLALDEEGDPIVTGTIKGNVVIGGALLEDIGAEDAFVAKLGAGGEVAWARRFGGKGFDAGLAVGVAPGNAVFAGGVFTGMADLGGSMVVSTGAQDAYVMKLAP